MNANSPMTSATQLTTRAPTRLLATVTAAAVLVIGMLGQGLLGATTAAAFTRDEQLYISLLADEGIGPTAAASYADIVFIGHAIAYDLRNGVHPADAAYTVWLHNPFLNREGAAIVVAAAMVAFAPELLPVYSDRPTGPPLTGLAV